jgi:small conductance mechanosensitive channel
MLNAVIAALPSILIAFIVFALFYVSAKGISSSVVHFTRRRQRHRNLGLALGRLSQWVVVFIGGLVALSIILPTFKAGDLIQLLGIGGVAIGFAFRDILQNFLAGILLLITEPFRIDDQIVFGEFEGTVEDIHTRATLIRTYDGRQIVIPNAKLFTESVTVNTAFDARRLEYDVSIGVSDDIDRARALILEAVRGVQSVLPEPAPDVLVVRLADFSVQLRVRWWIQPPRRANALDMQDQVLAAIKNTLVANGIDLPFPTQQILFHDQTEETDGDRTRQREGWPAGKDSAPQPRSIAGALERAIETGPSARAEGPPRSRQSGA